MRNKPRRVSIFYLLQRQHSDEAENRWKSYIGVAYFVSTLVHILLFLYVGFRTLISPWLLVAIYVLGIIVMYFRYKKRQYSLPGLRAYLLFPLFVNVLLTLNYFISWNAQRETFRFFEVYERVSSEYGRSGVQVTSMIRLEDRAYDSYFGIRVFSSPDKFAYTDTVTYTFRQGLLGPRVMTDYEFH